MKIFTTLLITLGLGTQAQAFDNWERGTTNQPQGNLISDLVYNSYTDPIGDNFGQLATHDVTSFSVARNNNQLDITLSYELFIQPDRGLPTSDIYGVIELDVDADYNTGYNQSTYNNFCPSQLAMGVDYVIYFPALQVQKSSPDTNFKGVQSNLAELYDDNDNFIATISITQNANSIVVHLPDNLIGSPADPIYLSAVAGNIDEPTDCSPDTAILALDNRGTVATAVPTLSFWMMTLMILGIGFLGYRRQLR